MSLVRPGWSGGIDERATGRGERARHAWRSPTSVRGWDGDLNVELCRRCSGQHRQRAGAAAARRDGSDRRPGRSGRDSRASSSARPRGRGRTVPAGTDKPVRASGELVLDERRGWARQHERLARARPALARRSRAAVSAQTRRVPPPSGASPLVAIDRPTAASRAALRAREPAPTNGGHDQTVYSEKCPILPGFPRKGRSGPDGSAAELSGPYRGFALQRAVRTGRFSAKPRQKPRQKPRHPPRARGRNPRTPDPRKPPPTPLKGGARVDSMLIEQTYVTERGRKRRRPSASTSRRCGAASDCPARRSRRLGAHLRALVREPSARASSRSGWTRSS